MTRLREKGTDADGRRTWVLHLLPLEATLVQSLPDQVEALLTHPDGNQRIIDRLFPPAYADPDEQASNRELLGASLLDERRALLSEVRRQLESAQDDDEGEGVELPLDVGGIDLWLRFLNDVRLILATDLGLETDLEGARPAADHPDAPKHALLEYLSGVEALLVDAASREF